MKYMHTLAKKVLKFDEKLEGIAPKITDPPRAHSTAKSTHLQTPLNFQNFQTNPGIFRKFLI